jgi:hypothetical protein
MDDAGTIAKLSQSLLDLKRDFDSGITVQTAVISLRNNHDVVAIRAC